MGSSVFALSISVDRFERAPKPFSQSHLIDNAIRIDYTADAIWIHCSYLDRQRDDETIEFLGDKLTSAVNNPEL